MIIRRPNELLRRRIKVEKYGEWHNWFAWYPVRVDNHRVAWLEVVNRRLVYVSKDDPRFYGWEYTLSA